MAGENFPSERTLIADRTRLKIMLVLSKRLVTPIALSEALKKGYMNIAYHLKILLNAGMVEKAKMRGAGEKRSRYQDYKITSKGLIVLEEKGYRSSEMKEDTLQYELSH